MGGPLPDGGIAEGGREGTGGPPTDRWSRCPWFVDREGTLLRIRSYRPGDRAGLVAMYEDLDAYSRTLGLPPKTHEGVTAWVDHLLEDGWSLVASDDGEIVAHVAVVPADADEPEFVVFVHQDYQHGGVGTELLARTIDRAAAAGHDALLLTVATGNETAIALFEALGFEVIDRLEWEQQMRLGLDGPDESRDRRLSIGRS